ncbi:hypothetical protein GOODEAATRI_020787, partial [Goodea atripinnis]
KYISSTSDTVVSSEIIPEEVLDSECPYPDLMDSLIQAFQSLSQRYQGRLQSLKEQLEKTDKFCGWCPDDHQQFQFTVSMYTHDIPNYRALCMDMLLRQFPDRTRLELVSFFFYLKNMAETDRDATSSFFLYCLNLIICTY